MASLRRSWQLTLGRFWRVVGVLVVTSIIVGVVQQVLAFGFQLVGTLIGFAVTTTADESVGSAFMVIALGASIVGSLVAGVLTQPFVAAVTALLYVDARIRREGFDLALVRAASGARVTG
jgi:mannose/fructose/N-acetylgalactosamine-specific phosphotransferase system component IID